MRNEGDGWGRRRGRGSDKHRVEGDVLGARCDWTKWMGGREEIRSTNFPGSTHLRVVHAEGGKWKRGRERIRSTSFPGSSRLRVVQADGGMWKRGRERFRSTKVRERFFRWREGQAVVEERQSGDPTNQHSLSFTPPCSPRRRRRVVERLSEEPYD